MQVEIGTSSLVALFEALLGTRQSPEIGGAAPHEGKECQCPGCKLARFELPVAFEAGEELNDAIVEELKELIAAGESSQRAAAASTKALCLRPLAPSVERILMQYRVDRICAVVRAQDALIALLPSARTPPESVRVKAVSLDGALKMLKDARELMVERLARKKAAAAAVAEVEKTVDDVVEEAANG
jgi:hypothetical protein